MSDSVIRRPRRAAPPTKRAAATVIAAVLGLTACGGGSPTTKAGSSSDSSSSSQQALAFSRCMRSDGVPNFPDPGSNGDLAKPQVVNARKSNSARFDAANSACQHLLPNGGNGPTPAELQQAFNDDRSFARCMRSHGESNFPEPTRDDHGRPHFDLQSVGIDQNSPQVIAKARECQSLLHLSSRPGPSGG